MTMRDLAERWVAIKNTARPSPNTASARVSDLWAIGQSLAGTEHTDSDKLGVLEDLSPADVTLSRLEDAFREVRRRSCFVVNEAGHVDLASVLFVDGVAVVTGQKRR